MRLGRASLGLAAAAIVVGLSWVYLARPDPHQAFRAAVLDAPGCQTARECTVLRTSCPLGCAHAVPVSAYDTLSALADRYVQQSRKRDGACAQDCELPAAVICDAGRCAFAN